jgi:branched-chain amino acid transport system ATP-binding protein
MRTLLAVEGVSKHFGGVAALNDVRLSVAEGEIFGIIGPNGSGKTTLLNLISSVVAPDGGKILYEGHNIVGYPPSRICRMGLVRTFQSTVSFPDVTVFQNVVRAQIGHAFAGMWAELLMTRAVKEKNRRMGDRAVALLRSFGLEGFADVQARALPYGYQKLLGLAMATAGDPKLLMLDEPAAGLTLDERSRLVSSIQKIHAGGVSVILVEHDMKMIMGLCHRILVIQYGEVIAVGTPTEIQRDERVIRAYLGEDDGRA